MSIVAYFETHSTTLDNEAGVATGWLPGTLSPTGRLEALGLGDRIAIRDPAAVIASDLARARETVEIALADQEVPIFYDWRLRECDYGAMNGSLRSDVLGPIKNYVADPYPGGESWEDAVMRAELGIRDIARWWAGETVVIVGHVATRWALDRLATGRPLAELIDEEFVWQPGWSYIVSG